MTHILDAYGRPLSNSLENPELSLHDPATWQQVLGGIETHAGVRVNARSALAYPPLWRAICLLSGDVGRMPLITYRRLADGGKERDRNHPAFRLLRRKANRFMRASTFKRTLTFHALFRGNGFAAIFRDAAGTPRELCVLDPDLTAQAIVEGEVWYVTEVDGEPVRLPAEDVFHVRGLSHDGIWGIDVLDLMREALGLGMATREFQARWFGEGSNQSGVLMVPATFPDDKIRNTLKMWNEVATGLAKSHRVAMLKDNVKFVPTTVSPQHSQLIETLQHEVMTVAAITGVPPHKLGDTSRTSYNSLEMENQSYLDDALEHWLTEFEEEADDKLLTAAEQEADSHFHEFNRTSRLRTDATTRADVYRTLSEIGALTINDILQRENMPTIGPAGDVRYRPANWQTVDTSVQQDQLEQAEQIENAHRQLVREVINRRIEIEDAKVLRAAGRERNFVEWINAFYAEHCEHLIAALETPRRAIEAHRGRDLSRRWRNVCRRYCEQAAAALLDLTGQATADTLTNLIEADRADRTDRARRLVRNLLGGKDARRTKEHAER